MKILHVGLPKTGTTSLQTGLLDDFCKANLLEQNSHLTRKIVMELRFPSEDINAFDKLFKALPKRYLLSAETLTGFNPVNWGHNLKTLLQSTDQDVKLILCLRKPSDWLRSAYLQLAKSNFYGSFNELFSNALDKKIPFYQNFVINTEIYGEFLSLVRQEERIKVYFYSKQIEESFLNCIKSLYPDSNTQLSYSYPRRTNHRYGWLYYKSKKIKSGIGRLMGVVQKDMYSDMQFNWQKEGEELVVFLERLRPINRKKKFSGRVVSFLDSLFYINYKFNLSDFWLQEMKDLDKLYNSFREEYDK